MIYLNINRQNVDLYDNFNFQLTDSNIMFSFDNIQCERTTEFKIPATAHNQSVLNLCNDWNRYGESARVKYEAQLQVDTVVYNGYLYINSANRNEYSCVFVTGNLTNLLRLREMGKLADVINLTDDTIIGADSQIYDANDARVSDLGIARVRYQREGETKFSVSVNSILRDIAGALSEIGMFFSFANNDLRIIRNEAKPLQDTPLKITSIQDAETDQPTLDDPTFPVNELYLDTPLPESSLVEVREQYMTTVIGGRNRYYLTQCIYTLEDIELVFPDNFPRNFVLAAITEYGYGKDYLGDYSVTKNDDTGEMRFIGQPLAGRAVAIEKGVHFMLFNAEYLRYAPLFNDNGWNFLSDGLNFQLDLNIRSTKVYAVRDNVPDISCFDFIKIIANIYGKAIYADNTLIRFDDIDIDGQFEPLYLDNNNIIQIGDITRTALNFAQRNYIQFKSSDGVYENERIRTEYVIDNANIAESKVLFEIPFSEGGQSGAFVYVREETKEDVLARMAIGTDNKDMLRVELYRNATIENLCSISTEIAVSIRMSLIEYKKINQRTKIFVLGSRWVHLSKQYSDGVCKLSLTKV